MDKVLHRSTRELLKSQQTDKRRNFKSITLGSLIGVFIASTPFLFYAYNFIPESKTWETYFFTYHSGFYENARIAFWMILGKLVPLLILFIWFFTCRHWWYHALLVPIAMFIYQTFGVISDDIIFFDRFELIYLVPVMAIIIPSIYLIRAKMFDKINNANKSMKDIEDEFMIKPKGFKDRLKQYF